MDYQSIFKWWFFIFCLGLIFFPISQIIFARFFDRGYVFAKSLGLAITTYIVMVLGILHVLPFTRVSLFAVLLVCFIINFYIFTKKKLKIKREYLIIFVFQEILFLLSLIAWSYIKSFQPDINGLEKYMDFGFMNSILRSTYFPPVDMWFPPFSINYYYFGHLTTALVIKLTNISPFVSFNLMLATIFAFTTTSSFSIVATITQSILKKRRTSILAGLLAGILTSLGGNLHTIYTFFKPYTPPENPVPFWQLSFLPHTFPNNYWYPNATRFIPFTIHEFPAYSFVVSDLHGHVLDIPFVFLTLGIVLSIFLAEKISYKISFLLAFMLSVMYMTNAWDGIIYFLLFFLTVLLLKSDILKTKVLKNFKWYKVSMYFKKIKNKSTYLLNSFKLILFVGVSYILFSLPFNLGFKPFVSGIGIICPPDFLVKIGKIGPLIFEADHCQRTPFWMLLILYGFFYIFSIALVFKIAKLKKTPPVLIYILLLILVSTILIATPEFIYAKDIYPAHYRANTMFKLGYQAFIMLSLVTSFSITYLLHKGKRLIWLPVSFVLLSLILIYPYFAVRSYFGDLKVNKGLDGLSYLKTLHPDDYEAVLWIQKNINGQPIILEAQGDSYTDYGRVSANTGLPTPLGWTVHEWLWRGDYSFPQSRLEDIRILYEGSVSQVLHLKKKYNISYVYVGNLERTKYPSLNEEKFRTLGKVVFEKGNSRIYKL